MRLDHQKEAMICDHCHNIEFPAPDRDGIRVFKNSVPERCPICAVPLLTAAAGGQPAFSCPRCRGLLVESERFLVLITELRAQRETPPEAPRPAEPRDLDRRIRCPRCHEFMDTHPYGGPGNIVIDNCPACELNWLDHGELRRIVAAP